MVSTFASQPFAMNADRSLINYSKDERLTPTSTQTNDITKVKSELSWSQLINAEIIGTKKMV